MIIIGLKTDTSEAHIEIIKDGKVVVKKSWQAGRKLADQLNKTIEETLSDNNLTYEDVEGIAIFKGPGSYTGLRIGTSVANTLSYALGVPIVSETGENWLNKATNRLINGENDNNVIPEYGGRVNITKPRK